MNDRIQALVLDLFARFGLVKAIPIRSQERERMAAQRRHEQQRRSATRSSMIGRGPESPRAPGSRGGPSTGT